MGLMLHALTTVSPYHVGGHVPFAILPSQTSDDQHEELKQVRKHINTCFKSATCFLMPYPGSRVATSITFDGRLAGKP